MSKPETTRDRGQVSDLRDESQQLEFAKVSYDIADALLVAREANAKPENRYV